MCCPSVMSSATGHSLVIRLHNIKAPSTNWTCLVLSDDFCEHQVGRALRVGFVPSESVVMQGFVHELSWLIGAVLSLVVQQFVELQHPEFEFGEALTESGKSPVH